MARKRSFASIEQLPSKRWRVRYTGPDGAIHNAPHTFAARIDAEAYAIAVRRKIDQDQWDATDDDPKEQITFGVYAARWLANRQVAGRPHQGPHPRALPARSWTITCCRRSGTGSSRAIKPKDVRDVVRGDAGRPADDAHRTPTRLLRTIMASRGQRRDHRRQPGPDRRRRPRQAGPPDPARRRSTSSACSPRRCPSGCG